MSDEVKKITQEEAFEIFDKWAAADLSRFPQHFGIIKVMRDLMAIISGMNNSIQTLKKDVGDCKENDKIFFEEIDKIKDVIDSKDLP